MTKPIAVVIYDLETTDQESRIAMPLQVAAIMERANTAPTIVMNCLANPGKAIDAGASEVHGIYAKDVRTSPPAEIVLFQLGAYIEGLSQVYEVIIAGQNHLAYDNPISARVGWEEVHDYPQIDTLTLARRLYPRLQNHKLDTLYAMATGKALEGAHDASVDVMAVGEVIRHMLPEFDNDYMAMAKATTTPTAWEVMPISKSHKGKMVREVPMNFWKWMLTNTNIGFDCPDFAETIKTIHPFLYEAHIGNKQ